MLTSVLTLFTTEKHYLIIIFFKFSNVLWWLGGKYAVCFNEVSILVLNGL